MPQQYDLDPSFPIPGTGEAGFEPPGGGDISTQNIGGNGFDWATAINTLIGAVAGYKQGKASQQSEKENQKRIQAARAAAGPENFAALLAKLQPIFREIVASGLGPQFAQGIASNLARRGLVGSGVGTALQNAALAAPDIFALQQAAGEAGRIQTGQVGAELGLAASLPPQVRLDPLVQALTLGARANYGTRQGREPETLFPNLTPVQR